MYRLFGFFFALLSLPAANAAILFTDATYSGGVMQYGGNEIGTTSGGTPSFDTAFAFVLPTGQYDDIGFDAILEVFTSSGTTTMSIYSATSGSLPNTSLGSVTVSPSLYTAAEASGSFSPSLTLSGGTTYFLALSTTASQVTWWGPSSNSTGNLYQGVKYSTSPNWSEDSGFSLGAFDITGDAEVAAPEPATAGALLIGLFVVGWLRRRSLHAARDARG